VAAATYTTLLPSTGRRLLPFVPQRNMIIVLDPHEVQLNNLRDNPGAIKHKLRIGRGIGTGLGKTAGRGHKGQKSRTGRGKPAVGREGGQTPIYRTLRKFGFKNTMFARRLQGLNLNVLQHHIDNGTINPYRKITLKELYEAQCVGKKIIKGVKLLAGGADHFTTPNLQLEVSDCSEAARDAIEKLGGKVDLVYHNRLSLRYTTKPEKFFLKPTFARPPPKLHQNKYPNFPDPTPFTRPTDVIADLEYPPTFDADRIAASKKRSEIRKATPKPPRTLSLRELKKEEAMNKASAKIAAETAQREGREAAQREAAQNARQQAAAAGGV